MNGEQIQAQWKLLKGRVKQAWGRLTHNGLTTIAGKRDRIEGKREQLAEKLEAKHLEDQAHADKELEAYKKSLDVDDNGAKQLQL